MCRNFPKLLTAPAEAIAIAKKRASYGDALGTLIVDGIIMAIATAIFITQIGAMSSLGVIEGQGLGMAAIGMFVLTFLGGLFFALLVNLVTNTLGGNGDYLHGLTTTAYTLAAPAIGFLATAIFFVIPWVGPIIGLLALSIGIALGVATLYRAIKDLYATDMVTSLVAVGILMLAITAALTFLSPMLGLSGISAAIPKIV